MAVGTLHHLLPAGSQRLERSRARLRQSVADGPFTFIRSVGNTGDLLIDAGTRRLFAGLAWREVPLARIERESGGTAIVAGGGAWCGPFHELLPPLLPYLESRFDRVVILPSSFDVSVESVRRALSRTRALVFAREEESFSLIRDICNADLADDCAFFFDYEPYRHDPEPGSVLDAFREDAESASGFLPGNNEDISVTRPHLDDWLWTIARRETIRTDRAHVMIAGAMLGRRVEYRSSAYHKLPAIARFSLAGFPVVEREARKPAASPGSALAPRDPDAVRIRLEAAARRASSHRIGGVAGAPRITALMLSWNRPERTRRAVESLERGAHVPLRLLLLDNGSRTEVRESIRGFFPERSGWELRLLPENLGTARGRSAGLADVETEYVLLIDDDVEIFPGAIEALLDDMERHPDAIGAGANTVLPNGRVQWCGADYRERGVLLERKFLGEGREFDDPAVGSPGPCRWVPGAIGLYRTEFFRRFPLDPEMRHYFEDIEWCYRAGRGREEAFRRVPEALAVHHHVSKAPAGEGGVADLAHSLPYVESLAHFYAVTGLVIEDVFIFVPQLRSSDGSPDVAAARLLLELVAAKGPHGALLDELNGYFAPLYRAGQEARISALYAEIELRGRETTAAHKAYETLHHEVDRIHAVYARTHAELDRVHAACAGLHAELDRVHAEFRAVSEERERLVAEVKRLRQERCPWDEPSQEGPTRAVAPRSAD
jgi:GT2 family glycosyltransferase